MFPLEDIKCICWAYWYVVRVWMSLITFDVFQNGFNSKSTWNFIQKAIKKLSNGGNSNQQVGGHFSKSMSLIPTRYFITLSTATANRQKVLEQTDIPENGLICHKVCTAFFPSCEILESQLQSIVSIGQSSCEGLPNL